MGNQFQQFVDLYQFLIWVIIIITIISIALRRVSLLGWWNFLNDYQYRQYKVLPTSVTTFCLLFSAAGRNVVFYRLDDTNLAVGFHHPERRVLHGKPLPPGFDVVQLTWVNGSETSAPLVLGDIEENASLSAGKFFALPRKNLVKVVASN